MSLKGWTATAGTDLSVSAQIVNTFEVIKTGAGTLELTADNGSLGSQTYVKAGTLLANNSAGTAAGNVTVEDGGTLGGTGAVGGAVIVLEGGTLAPGASVESLDVGALTFDGGSTFEYEIDSTALLNVAADLVNSSELDINAGAELFVDILGSMPIPLGTTFTLISYPATVAGWNGGFFTYAGSLLADEGFFTVEGQEFRINYDNGLPGVNFPDDTPSPSEANYVTVTRENSTAAVPEASVFLFGSLVCAALGLVAGVPRWTQRSTVAA